MKGDASAAATSQETAGRRYAIAAFLLFAFVLLFPIVFMERVLSPVEALYAFEPWRADRAVELQSAAARETALTVLPMLESSGVWDPSAGGGVSIRPAEAWSPWKIVSQQVAAPWRLTLIVLLQLTVGFVGAFLWLREEGYSRFAASIGAVVAGLSGVCAVNWMLPEGYALSILPLLLYFIVRHERGRGSIVGVGGLLLLLILSPSRSCIVALIVAVIRIAAGVGKRRLQSNIAVGALVAVSIAFGWTVDSFERGRLDLDSTAKLTLPHLLSLAAPELLGSVSAWQGNPAFGTANDFAHSTLFFGRVALLLLLAALVGRPDGRSLLCAALLGVVLILTTIASPLVAGADWRLAIPVLAAYLVARGAHAVDWLGGRFNARQLVRTLVVFATVFEAAFFAAAYLPYSQRSLADPSEAAVAEHLASQIKPYRVIGLLDYLPADTASLIGVEDLRARRLRDVAYGRRVAAVQHDAVKGSGRIEFDPQRIEFASPLLAQFNVRYLLEHKSIDLLRWRAMEGAVVVGTEGAKLRVPAGSTFVQYVEIDRDDVWSIDVFAQLPPDASPFSSVRFAVVRPESGEEVWSRTFTHREMLQREKFQLPLRPHLQSGNLAEIRISPSAAAVSLVSDAVNPSRMTYALLTTPAILHAELPDGRVFENLAALPRFYASWEPATGDVQAAAAGNAPQVDPVTRRAHLRVARRGGDYLVTSRAAVPFVLASSEKLSRELIVEVDGKRVEPVAVNGVFAAAFLSAGEHVVTFSRRAPFVARVGLALMLLTIVGVALFERAAVYGRLRATRID